MAFARITRFTDVTEEQLSGILDRVKSGEGPPEGVDSTGLKVFHDADQGTAVVVGSFETEEKMKAADKILEKMDPSDTPGTRASVDRCEVKAEANA